MIDATSKETEDEICHTQVPPALSKPIIRSWEEIIHNKHRTDHRYNKEVTFHIVDYFKPIQSQNVGFLQKSSSSHALDLHQISKCQHC